MPRQYLFFLRHTLWLTILASSSVHSLAQIQNGGFETGTLANWTSSGAVEVVRGTSFTPNLAPPVGTYMVLLSSTPWTSTGTGADDLDGNGVLDGHVATLSQTFTMSAAGTLSFTWSFLTSEQLQAFDYDDIFEVTLNNEPIMRRSTYKPGGASPWTDTETLVAADYTVATAGSTNGSHFLNGRTGYATVCVAIPQAGTYTLRFRVADQGDLQYDSGLVVDSVEAPSTCTPTQGQITTTTGSNLTQKSGGFVFTQTFNRGVGMSAIGPVMAFVSNASMAGNSNLQTQVFTHAEGVIERLTTMTDRDAGRPSLTSTGRFVAFASNGDLVPPGNTDGNWEIFRWDRTNRQMLQITSTTGTCENKNPSISGDNAGNRIAFQSTCTAHGTYSNADGNDEIVLWDSTTGFTGTNTPSPRRCLDPSISRIGGRYVAFSSDANIPTNLNTDLNREIFRWDTTANTYTRVTNSTSPVTNTSPSISGDGTYIAFVGSGAYNGNTDNNLEAWRWQSGGTYVRLTNTDSPLTLHVIAALGDDPRYVAVERLDAITGNSEILQIDATNTTNPLIVANNGRIPSIGYVGNTPLIGFESSADFTTHNADLNSEIWTSTTMVGTRKVYCQSHEPALAIPDNNTTGVNSTITLSDTDTISDLDVFLQINHTRVSDLYVTLTHGTTTIVLITQPAGCSGDNIQATLDDEATSGNADAQCATTVPTIYGTFKPDAGTVANQLSKFDGQSLSGNWVLNVSDRARNQTGTLVKWCLYAQTN